VTISPSRLIEILEDGRSVVDLQRYYTSASRDGSRPEFAGSRFETLDGGGGKSPDMFTAADLLAVEMLSVQVPALVTIALLEGDLGIEMTGFLREIPKSMEIHDPAAKDHLGADSAASAAWSRLNEQDGVAWVTAGKLLARKRPLLIPVYDKIVRCAYGCPPSGAAWLWLQEMCADSTVWSRLQGLHDEAGLPSDVGLLRVLDVTFWMRHRTQHTEPTCSGIP
jgi:hypothetical protein